MAAIRSRMAATRSRPATSSLLLSASSCATSSRLAASSLLLSASSCATSSRLAAMRCRCCQSRPSPHQCSTYLGLRIGHDCYDERLDENHAHTHTYKTRSDSSDSSGTLSLEKPKGAVGNVEWGDAAKLRPQAPGGSNKILNHDLMGYVSENVEGYAARRWIESCERACASHGSLVRHVWKLDCRAAVLLVWVRKKTYESLRCFGS